MLAFEYSHEYCVPMNNSLQNSIDRRRLQHGGAPWEKDLERSRDVNARDKLAFAFLLHWFESWRLRNGLESSIEHARIFWKVEVYGGKGKASCLEAGKSRRGARKQWQLDQWKEAMRWYSDWLDRCAHQSEDGSVPKSLYERVQTAVRKVGSRRGLALRTIQTYSNWASRYGVWVESLSEVKSAITQGDGNDGARAMLNLANARDWLTFLVEDRKVSYSTQKQALNALVFFYKDVCGMEEVDIAVKFRKRTRHIPTVLIPSSQLTWRNDWFLGL